MKNLDEAMEVVDHRVLVVEHVSSDGIDRYETYYCPTCHEQTKVDTICEHCYNPINWEY